MSTPVPDAVALMAWAFKDQLIQRLDAEITTESDDARAMSHGQRQQAEAETQTDLLEVERHEAALTWAAQAQGLPVEHRANISPLAILQVRLVTTPRSNALPGTSAGHAFDIVGARR